MDAGRISEGRTPAVGALAGSAWKIRIFAACDLFFFVIPNKQEDETDVCFS
jgi:hypothetical protein